MDTTETNSTPKNSTAERRRGEAGMTTAEYTVGTLGACSVAAVLIKIAHKHF